MRLMCMMALITAIILSTLVVVQSLQQSSRPASSGNVYPSRDPEVIYIIFGFLIAAFAPKAVQKFAEQKLPVYVRTPTYAGYLPPAPAVAPPAPVAAAPAVVPAQAVPPPPVSPPAAAPVAPNPLQTVVQRGTL